MAELSDAGRAAMQYWGIIERAAAEKMPTADVWAAIREQAESMGFDSPGVTARGVSELRGRASQIQRLSARLERLPGSTGILAEHLAEAPWARPLTEQAGLPIYQVRYQHTFTTPEGPQTEWRSSMFHGSFPATLDDLHDAIEDDASELANKYGVAHGDVSNLQIMRV